MAATILGSQLPLSLTFFSELVVYASLLGVGEDLVGLRDLLEPVLCVGVAVLVRVELEGHLPVGLLDLVLVGLGGDTQDFVEVLARGLDGEAGCVLLRLAALLLKQEQRCIHEYKSGGENSLLFFFFACVLKPHLTLK